MICVNLFDRLALAFGAFAITTAGSRLRLDAGQEVRPPQRDLEKVVWVKDDRYVCLKKWEKSSKKFVGRYCLASLDGVLHGAELIKAAQERGKDTPSMQLADDVMACRSESNPHTLKVCNLKGKEDIRLAYKAHAEMPLSCFREAAQNEIDSIVLEAAVSGRTCYMMKELSPRMQGVFAQKKLVMDSPSTTTTTTNMMEVEAEAIEQTTTTSTHILMKEQCNTDVMVQAPGGKERLILLSKYARSKFKVLTKIPKDGKCPDTYFLECDKGIAAVTKQTVCEGQLAGTEVRRFNTFHWWRDTSIGWATEKIQFVDSLGWESITVGHVSFSPIGASCEDLQSKMVGFAAEVRQMVYDDKPHDFREVSSALQHYANKKRKMQSLSCPAEMSAASAPLVAEAMEHYFAMNPVLSQDAVNIVERFVQQDGDSRPVDIPLLESSDDLSEIADDWSPSEYDLDDSDIEHIRKLVRDQNLTAAAGL